MPRQYAEMTTPAVNGRHRHTLASFDEDSKFEEVTEQPLRIDKHHLELAVEKGPASDTSSHVLRSDVGRTVVHVYEPSLQERAQHMMERKWGLYLELINLVLSVGIFSIYIAELYEPNLYASPVRRNIELIVTIYFIIDLGLNLFVAPTPWKYMVSRHGIIDMLTIIPSLIVYFVPSSRSQVVFVLRVLRIFRALRVLRLKQIVRLKQHGFEYELGAFVFSSFIVTLCAAGMFQALEEQYYTSINQVLPFHEALYFVMVSISTIGYGDITPHTTLGNFFVIVLILGIFTIIPRQVNKLNQLAKQSHPADKDYEPKHKSSGHVIVSGCDLSADLVLDFLQEFYHASRGTIHLEVVFIGDALPSQKLLRLLGTDKYRRRTCYLRGTLTSGNDQRRVRLETATAVFFLANKKQHQDSAQVDATTILRTMAVRNFADCLGKHLDIYVQLLSDEYEYDMATFLLGANATKTFALKNMVLARGAICPGASTLISNLLHSVDTSTSDSWTTMDQTWLAEYVDGLSNQIFPMVFSNRFEGEKYDDVVRNIYERYGALLITVRWKQRGYQDDTHVKLPLVPFQTQIREGDIGFVIAKSASNVLHIANSYGYWGERLGSKTVARPVRVSSDSLLRRLSPRSRFRGQSRESTFSDIFEDDEGCADNKDEQKNDTSWNELKKVDSNVESGYVSTSEFMNSSVGLPNLQSAAHLSHKRSMSSFHRDLSTPHSSSIQTAMRMQNIQEVQEILQRDYCRIQLKHLSDHYVICAGRLIDALSLVWYLRSYFQYEQSRYTSHRHHSKSFTIQPSVRLSVRSFIVLIERLPNAKDLIVLQEEKGEDVDILEDVLFVIGNSSKSADLARVAAHKARQVVILPSQKQAFHLENSSANTADPEVCSMSDGSGKDEKSLADFGVISSLLAVEITRQQHGFYRSASTSLCRRLSSQMSNYEFNVPFADGMSTSYQHEINQGLPLASVKLRMIDRYPGLNPAVFNENKEVIEATLQQYDAQAPSDQLGYSSEFVQSENTLAVLHYARSSKFCRPRDPAIRNFYPYLAPAVAGSNVFLSCVLDRIVCQTFYNPYITDVVEALAAGSGSFDIDSDRDMKGIEKKSSKQGSSSFRDTNTKYRRLFRVKVENHYVGKRFIEVFLDFVVAEMLVIGIFRRPNPTLNNLRPYVYTCPPPDAILHANDRLFVLG